MPIQPLSEATSRVLTSTQTLNNATSVVKELVENALDARASNILIEIAANSLDKIIVKDDGFGVGVQDRQLLCKRGCTSKIASLDDLAELGGTFLGFRGTALASIAELSKEVVITTRIDGEQAGTTMTFGRGGKLLSSASASHNTGTTIRIEHFLNSIPVRRQVVLKNPSKTLEEIKKLLQAYAFAKPSVKLSLKVLKAKNDKASWSFAACKDGDLLSAAVQVVGKAVASLCGFHIQESDYDDGSRSFRMEVVLLESGNGDIPKAGSVGQFISVDGRPVNQDKGVMKDLVKKYKSYLQHVHPAHSMVPSRPFCVIHLRCPDRSYDVNVEPAKDVVLFHNKEHVLDLAEKLFASVYGELEQPEVSKTAKSTENLSQQTTPSFDMFLARKTTPNHTNNANDVFEVSQGRTASSLPSGGKQSPIGKALVEKYIEPVNNAQLLPGCAQLTAGDRRISHSSTDSISRFHTEAVDDTFKPGESSTRDVSEATDDVESYEPSDLLVDNPFTRAKLYSLQRPRNLSSDSSLSRELVHSEQYSSRDVVESSPMIATSINSHRRPLSRACQPPTSETSTLPLSRGLYQNPGPSFPRRATKRKEHEGAEELYSNSEEMEHVRKPQSRRSVLREWVKPPAMADLSFRKASETNAVNLQPDLPHNHFDQTLKLSTTNFDAQYPVELANKPFRSPLKPKSSVEQPIIDVSRLCAEYGPLAPDPTNSSNDCPAATTDDDLQHILDFEQRKKMVNRRRKSDQPTSNPADLARIQRSNTVVTESVRSLTAEASLKTISTAASLYQNDFAIGLDKGVILVQSTSSQKSNPHHNRYLAAKRNLHSPLKKTSHFRSDDNSVRQDLDSSEISDATDLTSMLTKADPRGYMILHKRPNESSDATKANVRRLKSSRLPFETVPADAVKHDLLATPIEKLPPNGILAAMCKELEQYDVYIKRGVVEPIIWSPASREVEHWQTKLEALVNNSYRGRFQSHGREEQEDEQIPDMKIALVRALHAHLDSI